MFRFKNGTCNALYMNILCLCMHHYITLPSHNFMIMLCYQCISIKTPLCRACRLYNQQLHLLARNPGLGIIYVICSFSMCTPSLVWSYKLYNQCLSNQRLLSAWCAMSTCPSLSLHRAEEFSCHSAMSHDWSLSF